MYLQKHASAEVLPAGEFIGIVLSRLVEVEAELRVDAETEVVVHLHDLRDEETFKAVPVKSDLHVEMLRELNITLNEMWRGWTVKRLIKKVIKLISRLGKIHCSLIEYYLLLLLYIVIYF